MAKGTNTELETLTGIVLRAFPARKVGKYYIYDFVLRTGNGDLKVSKFGSGVSEFVGETVTFDASYSEQYTRYTVQSDIKVSGTEPEVLDETESGVPKGTVTPKRRGRPAKVQTYEPVPTSNVEPLEGFNQATSNAYKVVEQDVTYAKNVLGEGANERAVALLVQAIQAVRATILISQSKERHIADIKARR